ncbi:MAG TPA: hypothetical protein VHA82_02115 [Ramlibacter sp.]|uniref:hypothetical protein n=1 Tax=Ramlibacter sp. TaxID=1917967 RepID=UPI002CB5EF08|nr:hypothetical protein [Ramlibacter sp.]HVZ42576.1 hypothetical protein [Ramlibacter sp.]
MSRFVHIDYSPVHPGESRLQGVAGAIRVAARHARGAHGARGVGTLLLAGVVSALLVAANEWVDAWSAGHLLAAWMLLWAVGFAALALFAAPARRIGARLRSRWLAVRAWRRQARADEQLWKIALTDARVMADLSRAMSAAAERDVRTYS